jgi:hypothetical protein
VISSCVCVCVCLCVPVFLSVSVQVCLHIKNDPRHPRPYISLANPKSLSLARLIALSRSLSLPLSVFLSRWLAHSLARARACFLSAVNSLLRPRGTVIGMPAPTLLLVCAATLCAPPAHKLACHRVHTCALVRSSSTFSHLSPVTFTPSPWFLGTTGRNPGDRAKRFAVGPTVFGWRSAGSTPQRAHGDTNALCTMARHY